jgi:hypothetical protein
METVEDLALHGENLVGRDAGSSAEIPTDFESVRHEAGTDAAAEAERIIDDEVRAHALDVLGDPERSGEIMAAHLRPTPR